jgi:hypothetical protein
MSCLKCSNQCHLKNSDLHTCVSDYNYSNTMPNTVYFADNDVNLWSCQQYINEQPTFSNNSYPPAHQRIYPNPSYDQAANQDFSGHSSLLEMLLRHGKNKVSQNYVNLGGKPEAFPGGEQNMANIPCQSTSYTPTSSTDRVSPIVAFAPNGQEQLQVQQPQIQTGYFQNYQGYPTQQHPNSCVTPSTKMVTKLPTNYGAQHRYAPYPNNYKKRSFNEINDVADEHAQQPVDYPWMKSYSNGL